MTRSVEDSLVVRMEASLRKFERQMEQGRKAAVRSARGAEAAWGKAGKQIAANSNRAAVGLQRVTNVSGAGRFVLQNTANQIGDIAVQMGSGTSASRALGQQLPQLLGGFAALGGTLGVVGPLLGTVSALAIPVAAGLFSIGEDSEEAGKKTKTFTDKISAAMVALSEVDKAMSNLASGGLRELLEKYGEASEAVRELQKELLDIEVRAAKVEVGQVLDSALGDKFQAEIEKVFGGIGGAVAETTRQEILDLANEVSRMQASISQREELGVIVDPSEGRLLAEMREELALLNGDLKSSGDLASEIKIDPDLLVQINTARDALKGAVAEGDFSGVADGLSLVRDLLTEAGTEIDQGVLDGLVKADDLSRQAAERFKQAAKAVDEISENSSNIPLSLQPAVDAAAELAQQLGVSVGLAERLASFGDQGLGLNGDPSGKVYSGRGSDPRSHGGRAIDIQTAEAAEFLENYKDPSKGARAKADRERKQPLGEAQSLYRSTRTEAERYAIEIERINELHRQFPKIITSDVRDRAIDALKEGATEVGKMAQMMERSFEDAFASLVTGAGSGKDALRAFFADISRMAIRNVASSFDISGLMTGAFGGSGASGGLLGGKIIPGILHSGGVAGRDGYGHGRSFSSSTWAGAPRYHQGGIAGLKPGEVPAILKKGELVVPEGGSVSMPGAAQPMGTVQVEVFVNDDGKIGAIARSEAQDVAVQVVRGGIQQNNYQISQMDKRK
ncbi:hypothetical protein [Shimia sp.]|uniref:hypothetical protein n=1 Tax=Shimia sp. TaxID=1954381 RepID=UPI003BAA3374